MIEELTLNAWPALQTYVYDGWLLRFADGYTKRSNSVCALYEPAIGQLDGKIDYCERMYAERGLSPIFKIMSFTSSECLDRKLEERGYAVVEPSSVKMLRDLTRLSEPVSMEIELHTELDESWLERLAAFSHLSRRNLAAARQLLEQPGLKKGYFTLYEQGEAVACGRGAIERGYVGLYDIVTREDARNRGCGEQLIVHILRWARDNGASRSYLQVVQANAPANRLYAKLGYEEVYTYHYRVGSGIG